MGTPVFTQGKKMFCPQAADWGNVADWVAGIGAAFAVIATVWLGWSERRERRQERQDERIRDAEIENGIIVEALRLLRRMKNYTSDVEDQFKQGRGVSIGGWQRELRDVRETALRLQLMPGMNHRGFQIMNGVIELANYDSDPRLNDFDEQEIMFTNLSSQITYQYTMLREQPNPLAPLNW